MAFAAHDFIFVAEDVIAPKVHPFVGAATEEAVLSEPITMLLSEEAVANEEVVNVMVSARGGAAVCVLRSSLE